MHFFSKEYLIATLRKTEKYTKTDMVYLASGGFWQGAGQVLTGLISLALTIVFANYLPKETYGVFRYTLSIAGVLSIFTLTGMGQAVSQAVANGAEGVFVSAVKYQLKWNVLQFLVFISLSAYYLLNNNAELALSLSILGVLTPLTAALSTYGGYLGGKREFRLANIYNVVSVAVYAIGMATVIFVNGEVVWLIAVYALTSFGTTLYFYLSTLRRFKPPTSDETGADVAVKKYGRELTFIGFLGPIMAQIDKIILAQFWGATPLAVYSLATAVPNRATSPLKSWVGIGMPKFSTKTPQEINTIFYTRIFQGLLIGALCTGAYVLLSPYLFTYLLPKYLEALPFSQLLSASFIFALPNRYISLLMTSQKLSRLIFLNSIVQSAIKIGLYVILGIWGGVLGLIVANVSFSFISMVINITVWRFNTR